MAHHSKKKKPRQLMQSVVLLLGPFILEQGAEIELYSVNNAGLVYIPQPVW